MTHATFHCYFHKEDKTFFMLDHKKPEWLMKEQPYFAYIGPYTVGYQEFKDDLTIPASIDWNACKYHAPSWCDKQCKVR